MKERILVKRVFEGDRRSLVIEFTDLGEDYYRRIRGVVVEVLLRAGKFLDASELDDFIRLMVRANAGKQEGTRKIKKVAGKKDLLVARAFLVEQLVKRKAHGNLPDA